jgi:putative membrane protein
VRFCKKLWNNSRLSGMADNNNARDHLANERTFLAWIRTGVATIVFGFAVGRFSIALQEFMQFEKKPTTTPGLTAWLGMISIVAGVLLILAGLYRYRQTRVQIDTDSFEPAGTIIDLVAVMLAVFGIALAGYLAWIKIAQG